MRDAARFDQPRAMKPSFSSHRSRHSTSTATAAAPKDDSGDDDEGGGTATGGGMAAAAATLATRPRSALGFLSHRPFSRSGRRDNEPDDALSLSLVPRRCPRADGGKDDNLLGLLSPADPAPRRRKSSSSLSPSLSSSPVIPHSPSYTHAPPPPPAPSQISISRAAEWVTGDLPDAAVSDPARAAYDRARQTLAAELGPADSKWLGETAAIEDVEAAMGAALAAWQAKGKESKVVHWLRACSSRILHYGAIFEIFQNHHPEYVSLAYGAFKFLFVIVIQHEELCSEIAKAVARIAYVLPRMSLHTDLYRTEHMQAAISAVYAKIIEFATLAIRWCRRNRFLQSLGAIVKPWTIGYKTIADEIVELSRRVDEVAAASSQAEIRMLTNQNEMLHGKVDMLEGKIDLLAERLLNEQSLSMQILVSFREYKDTFRQEQMYDIRETFMLTADPVPDASLTYVRSLRNRRRQKTPTTLPPAQLRKLTDFMAAPCSQMMLAQGHGLRTSSLDFAADFVDIVLANGIDVLWALPDKAPLSATRDESSDDNDDDDNDSDSQTHNHRYREKGVPKTTVVGILRSMVLQALSINGAILSDGQFPITKRHLRAADTAQKWFALLQRCIISFSRLLVVIDLGVVEAAVASSPPCATTSYDDGYDDPFTVQDFVRELEALVERLPRRGQPLVKIVIVSWRFGAAQPLTRSGEVFGDERGRMYTDRGPRQERLARRPKYRAFARRRGEKMAERYREIVDKFEVREEGSNSSGGISEEESSDDDEAFGRYGSWNQS